MPILFLDFDGVLHPEHCHESRHFCRLPILEDALQPVPECRVVITSTWRVEQAYEALLQNFSPDNCCNDRRRKPQILSSNERPAYAGGVTSGRRSVMLGFGPTTCHITIGWLWMIDRGSIGRSASPCFWSMAELGLRRPPVRNLQLVFKAFFEKTFRGRRHDLTQQSLGSTRTCRLGCLHRK